MTQGDAGGEQASLPATIDVDGLQLPTWRNGQAVAPMSAQLMAITDFDDHASYHPALIGATLAAEQDPRFRDTIFKGGCGVKVRNIPGWDAPAAALIHARALLLAHHAMSRRPVYADDTWASVYRAGDYCMPHSHLRSNLSIVYMLDPGDEDPAGCACRSTVLRRSAHRGLLPARARSRDAARAADHERRHHAGLRQRLPAQRQSLSRPAAAHHAVVEYHAREIAWPPGRGLEDVAAPDARHAPSI